MRNFQIFVGSFTPKRVNRKTHSKVVVGKKMEVFLIQRYYTFFAQFLPCLFDSKKNVEHFNKTTIISDLDVYIFKKIRRVLFLETIHATLACQLVTLSIKRE